MDLFVFCNQLNMIGVRYISSYLKLKGIDVRIIYMISQADSFENIFSDKLYEQLSAFCKGSDLIGMSLTTNYLPEARRFSLKLKDQLNIPIVWGGVHPTLEIEECLEYADYVIRGEGEESSYELIATLVNNGDISSINNLAYKKDDKIIRNPLRPLKNLDDLPIPDIDFTSHYLIDENELKQISPDLMKKHMFTFSNKKRITYNISTTRGCPHSCTYCVNYAYRELFGAKGYVRKRTLENIMEELTTVLKKFPFIEYIALSDETFFIQKMDIIKSFSEVYKQKINLPLKIEFSPQTFNEEKLVYMLQAGAVELHMGVESGCDDTNYNIYNRNFPVNKIKSIMNLINKYIDSLEVVHIHILICNPFEKLQNTKETFRFIVDVPNNFHIRFFPLVLFPGTKLLSMAYESGLIKNKEKDVYLKTWNTIDSLETADYYTVCMIYLDKIKQKFKIGKTNSLMFYYFMSIPLIRMVFGSSTGKKVLVNSVRIGHQVWNKMA
jgi:anaerobic magnesium-protoporphyrin IX monomethyl ester cyclase